MADQARDAEQVQQPAEPQPESEIELATLPAPVPSQSIGGQETDPRPSSEHHEHQPCLEVSSSQDDSEEVPRKGQLPRRPLTNLGPSIFSWNVSLLPVYFLAFAVLAFQAEASPVLAGSRASWLLEVAKYVCHSCEESIFRD